MWYKGYSPHTDQWANFMTHEQVTFFFWQNSYHLKTSGNDLFSQTWWFNMWLFNWTINSPVRSPEPSFFFGFFWEKTMEKNMNHSSSLVNTHKMVPWKKNPWNFWTDFWTDLYNQHSFYPNKNMSFVQTFRVYTILGYPAW